MGSAFRDWAPKPRFRYASEEKPCSQTEILEGRQTWRGAIDQGEFVEDHCDQSKVLDSTAESSEPLRTHKSQNP